MNERKSSEGYQMPDFTEEYLRRYGMDKSTVDVFDLCRKSGIALIPWSEPGIPWLTKEIPQLKNNINADNDGFAFCVRKSKAIFYDDTRSPARQRATIAHELGHFVNGDLSKSHPPCKGHRCDECREWRADSFALNLLF